MEEVDKDGKIAELEALVAQLRHRLKEANSTITGYRKRYQKQYRNEQDYLPYEEREERPT